MGEPLSRHCGTGKGPDRDIIGRRRDVDEPCASLPAAPPGRARARRGNCRLFDTGRRNLARDGLFAGGRWIRTSRSAVDWQKFVVSSELGPIYRCTVIRAVAGLGEHRVVGRGPGAPPLTARIRRRHTKVALSAVRAHRGSKGSNPFPSRSESALWLRVRRNLTHLFWIDH